MDMRTDPPLLLQHPVVQPGDEALRIDLEQSVTALAVAPEGVRLALGTHRGLISVRCAQTGQEQLRLEGHRRRVNALAFAPGGTWLLSAGRDGTLRGWSLVDGAETQIWQSALSLNACATDGVRVLAGGDDGVVRALAGGTMEAELHGHRGMVTAVALLPDGIQAVSGGVDGVLILWDLHEGRARRLYRHAGAVTACDLSADGKLLVSSGTDGRLLVWDLVRGRMLGELGGHDGPLTACAVDARGENILSGASDRTVMVWSLRTGTRTQTFYSHDREVVGVAWGAGVAWSASADRSARAWDLRSQPGDPAYRLCHPEAVTSCLFLPSGDELISTSLDYTLRTWDVETGACRQILRGHRGAVNDAALSPGGRALASVANDGEIRLWYRDGQTWTPGFVLVSGQGPLQRCAFLAEGLLLTAGMDGTLRGWSLTDGTSLFSAGTPTSASSSTVIATFSDGRVAVANALGELLLWSGGDLLFQAQLASSPVSSLCALPDQRRLLVGLMDGTLSVFDTRTPDTPPTLLARHDGPVTGIEVAAGDIILTVSRDRALRRIHMDRPGVDRIDLAWPLTAVSARAGWIAAGDMAGNLWVFANR